MQIALSTAEESEYYFTGYQERQQVPDLSAAIPPGVYRIIDDQLLQIVEAPVRTHATARVTMY